MFGLSENDDDGGDESLAVGRDDSLVYHHTAVDEIRMKNLSDREIAIGIIGGSGLYAMSGIDWLDELNLVTPFGEPSGALVTGQFNGRKLVFLPRHGVGHRLLPHEINHRANIWAMRSLNVRWIISVSAVGSMRESIHPRELVVPDQLIDRTASAAKHTFFGNGIAAHVGFADPYCAVLRNVLLDAAKSENITAHPAATYLCMNGPAFSTRAEAAMHRLLGADVIGMTNAPEARLCREAEISAATLACVTDDDCWKTDEAAVTVESVIENLQASTQMAQRVIQAAIAQIPLDANTACHHALKDAIFTPRAAWPEQTRLNLAPILPED